MSFTKYTSKFKQFNYTPILAQVKNRNKHENNWFSAKLKQIWMYVTLIFGKSQIVNMVSAKINNNVYKCLDFSKDIILDEINHVAKHLMMS